MIERGLVEVNGKTVSRLPVFVDPTTDRVVVDGRPLRLARPRGPSLPRSRRSEPPPPVTGRVYIMLHKPDRVLCTTRDEAGAGPNGVAGKGEAGARATVIDLVNHRARLFPVGRLDYHSTGMVLLTNDGDLADRLTHARYGVTRTYRVTVKGHIRPDMLDDLRRRVGKPSESDPQNLRGVRVAREAGTASAGGGKPASANSILEITLREGKSRKLQSVLEQMGIVVRKLTRVGIGPLRLTGVAVGEWRELTRDEVRMLKHAGSASDSAVGGDGRRPPAPRTPRPPRKSEPAA